MSEKPNSVLICGESGSGKSFSLIGMSGDKGVLYINCEGGKPLPFKNRFKHIIIDDPEEIFDLLDAVRKDKKKRFHTVIIDTISFMMNRFESVHVLNASNSMAMWGRYSQFFPKLIYDYVAKSPAFFIMLGHLDSVLNEDTGRVDFMVPVKGALKKNGLEAFFTTVINCKKLALRDITKDASEGKLLRISSRDKQLGYKHVFQTRTVKTTVGDRIRSPYELFSDDETYIDNNAKIVVDKIVDYHKM